MAEFYRWRVLFCSTLAWTTNTAKLEYHSHFYDKLLKCFSVSVGFFRRYEVFNLFTVEQRQCNVIQSLCESSGAAAASAAFAATTKLW